LFLLSRAQPGDDRLLAAAHVVAQRAARRPQIAGLERTLDGGVVVGAPRDGRPLAHERQLVAARAADEVFD
jgi:hypothetical protein